MYRVVCLFGIILLHRSNSRSPRLSLVYFMCRRCETSTGDECCVGTLVMPTTALTTAYCAQHCHYVTFKNKLIPVIKTQIHPHYKIHVHEKHWTQYLQRNDIALVHFKHDFGSSDTKVSALEGRSAIGLKAVMPLLLDGRVIGISGIPEYKLCKHHQKFFIPIAPALPWIELSLNSIDHPYRRYGSKLTRPYNKINVTSIAKSYKQIGKNIAKISPLKDKNISRLFEVTTLHIAQMRAQDRKTLPRTVIKKISNKPSSNNVVREKTNTSTTNITSTRHSTLRSKYSFGSSKLADLTTTKIPYYYIFLQQPDNHLRIRNSTHITSFKSIQHSTLFRKYSFKAHKLVHLSSSTAAALRFLELYKSGKHFVAPTIKPGSTLLSPSKTTKQVFLKLPNRISTIGENKSSSTTIRRCCKSTTTKATMKSSTNVSFRASDTSLTTVTTLTAPTLKITTSTTATKGITYKRSTSVSTSTKPTSVQALSIATSNKKTNENSSTSSSTTEDTEAPLLMDPRAKIRPGWSAPTGARTSSSVTVSERATNAMEWFNKMMRDQRKNGTPPVLILVPSTTESYAYHDPDFIDLT